MPFSNLVLMRNARKLLGPHWGLGVLMTFIYSLLVGPPVLTIPVLGEIVPLLLSGPLLLGFSFFALSAIRKQLTHLNQLFDGFQSFFKCFLAYLCISILTLVGFFFFIIPGIIIFTGFSMTFFIMADRSELSFSECMHESWIMTDGHRLKYFGLCLRFIPWYILGFLCLGVGVFIIFPWNYTCNALFYEELKKSRTN